MGIGLDSANEGIVPRFIHSLFENLNSKKASHYSFQISVSFLELHNEDLIDLLSPVKGLNNLTIREDSHGNICWSGVREEFVRTPKELIDLLQKGSVGRTTASTDMNNTSSRSHAIFSVVLKQYISLDSESVNHNIVDFSQQQTQNTRKLVSKFHFVDLAGSERLKRTNAVGDRAKEGISINSGLLALGNVISALGDESRKASHIPYRDSKLTRLLQDSLGGNSQTLMLACASPAEINVTETLNTLKYANRARNIRNRVIINQELGETERLKSVVTRLKEELRSTDDFLRAVNDEMDSLKSEVIVLNKDIKLMADELAIVKYERDCYKQKLTQQGEDICKEAEDTITSHLSSVAEYTSTIEMLRVELMQAQEQNRQLQQDSHEDSSVTLVNTTIYNNKNHDEKIAEKRNKKRHRSIKRTKTLPKKRSISSSTLQPSNKTEKDRLWLENLKEDLETEMKFLQSYKVYIKKKYRRRTIDIPLNGTSHFDSAQDSSVYNSIEKHKLLQKLSKSLDVNAMLIQKFEKSENQNHQFTKKIDEATVKKTTVISQHKRDISEQRGHYECRLKKQQSEYQALRRKYTQLINKSDTYKNQQHSSMDQLNKKIEKLTHEKKKLLKRIKQESDRAKEKISNYDKEISKMKRQELQLLTSKKKAEREAGVQRNAYKRAAEEIVAISAQMKQIATILKKVMVYSNRKKNSTSNHVTYHNLLAKAAACANIRGYLINKSMTKKPPTAGTVKLKAATLQQHVFQKKKMIHKAIYLYQQELLSERKIVLEEEGNSEMDLSTPQYMDERIDLITLHLDTLNKQITQLTEKEVENSDDSEWTDIINNKGKDIQLGISNITDSQVAYEIALSVIRSLEPEEARFIAESFLEDIIHLKSEYQYHSLLLRHLNSTIQSFQTGLVQMRRLISHLDSSFIKMLNCPVYLEHGLILPKEQENLDVTTVKPKRLTITSPATPTAPSIKSPGYSSNLKEPHFKSCLPIFSGSSRVVVARADPAPNLLMRLTEG
ncbi:hypothetical protein K501DRAFT_314140 [Backusella circina FSU 941]|nr:hypothetical protein K501DRAFT_314140 [Backusella circina FSU 941]